MECAHRVGRILIWLFVCLSRFWAVFIRDPRARSVSKQRRCTSDRNDAYSPPLTIPIDRLFVRARSRTSGFMLHDFHATPCIVLPYFRLLDYVRIRTKSFNPLVCAVPPEYRGTPGQFVCRFAVSRDVLSPFRSKVNMLLPVMNCYRVNLSPAYFSNERLDFDPADRGFN